MDQNTAAPSTGPRDSRSVGVEKRFGVEVKFMFGTDGSSG